MRKKQKIKAKIVFFYFLLFFSLKISKLTTKYVKIQKIQNKICPFQSFLQNYQTFVTERQGRTNGHEAEQKRKINSNKHENLNLKTITGSHVYINENLVTSLCRNSKLDRFDRDLI